MPGPFPAVRALIVAASGAALVVTMLALPGAAAARDVDRPKPPPPASYAGHLARSESGDLGNPGYHYAVGHTQVLATKASGLKATLSVHRPGQVRGSIGQHSLGQIAMGHTRDSSYLEAGWRQHLDGPRLFVYWRPASGDDTCYNFGCGFRPFGPGLRPGSSLEPNSEVTVAFQHKGDKWWLKVNGRRSGFFPDHLWHGRFRGTDFAQLYGEVFTHEKQQVCADMGNGLAARNADAAYIRDAHWIGGPPLKIYKARSIREVHDYGYRRTGRNSFRYGGPGEC